MADTGVEPHQFTLQKEKKINKNRTSFITKSFWGGVNDEVSIILWEYVSFSTGTIFKKKIFLEVKIQGKLINFLKIDILYLEKLTFRKA